MCECSPCLREREAAAVVRLTKDMGPPPCPRCGGGVRACGRCGGAPGGAAADGGVDETAWRRLTLRAEELAELRSSQEHVLGRAARCEPQTLPAVHRPAAGDGRSRATSRAQGAGSGRGRRRGRIAAASRPPGQPTRGATADPAPAGSSCCSRTAVAVNRCRRRQLGAASARCPRCPHCPRCPRCLRCPRCRTTTCRSCRGLTPTAVAADACSDADAADGALAAE